MLFKRRSVRRFLDTKITDEQIEYMLRAGMQAPSANNQQPWDFIVVDQKELLEELSTAHSGAWVVKDAPLNIVVVMRDEVRSPDFAQQDCAAATENILLAAVELGLGAVWVGVKPNNNRMNLVNQVLHINKGYAFAQIAIGYPKDEKDVTSRYDQNRIYYNKME